MTYKTYDDVKRVVSLAKPEGVIRIFWESYQSGLQYQAWLDAKQAEYDVLFPKTKEVTEVDEEGVETIKVVDIDYSEVEGYVTFEQWMQEREVVTLTRTVFDEEGNELEEEYEADGDLIRQFTADPSLFAELKDDPVNIILLKKKLADTDYKDLPSYKPKEGEVIAEVIAQRDAWREEIRRLELL